MFDPIQYVGKAIAKANEPFHVGGITAYRTEDLFFDVVISVEVEKLPRDSFTFRPSRQQLMDVDPKAIAVAIAQEAYNYYFYRSPTPVDDHIILGEN